MFSLYFCMFCASLDPFGLGGRPVLSELVLLDLVFSVPYSVQLYSVQPTYLGLLTAA